MLSLSLSLSSIKNHQILSIAWGTCKYNESVEVGENLTGFNILRIEWHSLQASQIVYFCWPSQPHPSTVPIICIAGPCALCSCAQLALYVLGKVYQRCSLHNGADTRRTWGICSTELLFHDIFGGIWFLEHPLPQINTSYCVTNSYYLLYKVNKSTTWCQCPLHCPPH